MNYIVFDLEWNQASEGKCKVNKDMPFEIIEIGALKLNEQKCVIGEFNRLIKPSVYKDMHFITKTLSHIKKEELFNGKSFEVVVCDFLKWCGEDFVFCTWGPLDLTELQRNMNYYQFASLSNKPMQFLDIQKLFSLGYENGKSRRTLEYAIDYLKIVKDIPFHRAFSDAYYTVKVFQKIASELHDHVSFDLFALPSSKRDEIHIVFSDYSKYISRKFKTKSSALLDREVSSIKCYICKKALRKKIKWFTPNGKHYYAVSFCPNHGYLKGKIRIKKTEDNEVFVVKTIKQIGVADVEEILQKKERSREQRICRQRAKKNKAQ